MTKSYADVCLERAEKASYGPVEWRSYPDKDRFILCHKDSPTPYAILQARGDKLCVPDKDDGHVISYIKPDHGLAQFITQAVNDVPELARRLKIACDELRFVGEYYAKVYNANPAFVILNSPNKHVMLANALEEMPESK